MLHTIKLHDSDGRAFDESGKSSHFPPANTIPFLYLYRLKLHSWNHLSRIESPFRVFTGRCQNSHRPGTRRDGCHLHTVTAVKLPLSGNLTAMTACKWRLIRRERTFVKEYSRTFMLVRYVTNAKDDGEHAQSITRSWGDAYPGANSFMEVLFRFTCHLLMGPDMESARWIGIFAITFDADRYVLSITKQK